MNNITPEEFSYEKIEKRTTNEKGTVVEKKQRVGFAAEDIIATAAAVVAILFAIGMMAELLPVNKLTISVAGFSGVGVVVAKIIKARHKIGVNKSK